MRPFRCSTCFVKSNLLTANPAYAMRPYGATSTHETEAALRCCRRAGDRARNGTCNWTRFDAGNGAGLAGDRDVAAEVGPDRAARRVVVDRVGAFIGNEQI